MDLEHLTKHQIVLLTLLVSFVTSIATGIVTVSLVNQAPPQVERTINQIVDRTVETVSAPVTAVTTPTQKTVVVDDSDQTAASIAQVQLSVVRIVDVAAPDNLVARGIIIDSQGTTLTDRAAIESSGAKSLQAILADGSRVAVTVPQQATSTDTLTLNLAVGTSTGFKPAVLADPTKVQLGESLISIGGTGADSVNTGVVASAAHDGLIEASVSSATPGSVIIDLFGEVVGIMTGNSAAAASNTYTIPTAPAPTPTPAAKPSS